MKGKLPGLLTQLLATGGLLRGGRRRVRRMMAFGGHLHIDYSQLRDSLSRIATHRRYPRMGVPIRRPNIGGIAREDMMFTDYFPRRSTPLQRHADISRQSAGKVDDLGS